MLLAAEVPRRLLERDTFQCSVLSCGAMNIEIHSNNVAQYNFYSHTHQLC